MSLWSDPEDLEGTSPCGSDTEGRRPARKHERELKCRRVASGAPPRESRA